MKNPISKQEFSDEVTIRSKSIFLGSKDTSEQAGNRTRELTLTAVLGALLAAAGMFKIPGILPGTEFQLSAPFAVSIAACFGFRRYFKIGVTASIINLLLGTHTFLNVTVAMVFRLVAGGILGLAGCNPVTLILSGPLGTATSRLVLGQMLHADPLVLILGAVPGMIVTAAASVLLYPVMKRVMSRMGIPVLNKRRKGK